MALKVLKAAEVTLEGGRSFTRRKHVWAEVVDLLSHLKAGEVVFVGDLVSGVEKDEKAVSKALGAARQSLLNHLRSHQVPEGSPTLDTLVHVAYATDPKTGEKGLGVKVLS